MLAAIPRGERGPDTQGTDPLQLRQRLGERGGGVHRKGGATAH
ncbi:hypothetical protein [Streptomyces chartreusis]